MKDLYFQRISNVLKIVKRSLFSMLTLLLLSNSSTVLADLSDAKGLPADNKVMFFIGQDSKSLSDFKHELLDKNKEFPRPAGITLYTNLVHGAFLAGMGANPVDEKGQLMPGFNFQTNTQYDFGGGVQNFAQSMAEYPDVALNIGLYISDAFSNCSNQPLRAIHSIENDPVGGDITPALTYAYQNAIDVMINTFKSWDRQIYLRVGYEFDGVWNCYGSEFYKEVFRYIAKRVDFLNAHNVAMVWQSSTWPRDELKQNPEYNFLTSKDDHLDKWYPGDEYVDWVGLSTFFGENYTQYQWSCNEKNPEWFVASKPPRVIQNRLLDFARKRNKPVMIAEATPQGMQIDELSFSCIFYRDEKPIMSSGNEKMLSFNMWYAWYKEWFKFIKDNKDIIRSVSYINADWDVVPQFQCREKVLSGEPGCQSGYWGDSRIQKNEAITKRFARKLKADYWKKVEEAKTLANQ